MYSIYLKSHSYPGSYDTQVITSGQGFQGQQLQSPHLQQSHKQLPMFADTFQSPGFGAQPRPSNYGNVVPNTPQPRSVAPFSSCYITDTKRFNAPSNTNSKTSDYLDSKDSSKVEEMLNEHNIDEEYKTLILQQIASYSIKQLKSKNRS